MPHILLILTLMFFLRGVSAHSAESPEQAPLMITGEIESQYDNNFFKADDVDHQVALEHELSWVQMIQAEGKWSLSKQLLTAKIARSEHQFDYHPDFNHFSSDYAINWNWRFGLNGSGSLGADQSKALIDFTGRLFNYNSFIQKKSTYFDAHYALGASFELLGGGRRLSQNNSLNTLADDSFNEDSFYYGGRLTNTNQNYFGLEHHAHNGNFNHQSVNAKTLSDSGYQQDSYRALGQWQFSPKLNLRGYVGTLHRKHDLFWQRDFHGSIGSLSIDIAAHDIALLQCALTKDLNSFQTSTEVDFNLIAAQLGYYNASYFTRTSAQCLWRWQRSPFWVIAPYVKAEKRYFLGGLIDELAPRKDLLYRGGIQIEWIPRDVISVIFTVNTDSRASNVMFADFNNQMLQAKLRLNF